MVVISHGLRSKIKRPSLIQSTVIDAVYILETPIGIIDGHRLLIMFLVIA